ncbi:MAG: hybrid sensor histidine kinase/response regulator [Bacteroidales bacterium]|jgi:signal transduction histidine kinase
MCKKIKILHLEDSDKDMELIHSIIDRGELNCDYFSVDNETDFRNILETNKIDLILSDYGLPDYDGNQALKFARDKFNNIPFIFVSGTMGEDKAIDSMLNGATDYVLKTKIERLIPAIKRAILEHNEKIKRILSERKIKKNVEQIKTQNEQLAQINKELIIAKEKAEENDKLKTAFLQNMSHEIRTPLNGIIGFAGLMDSNDISREEIREFITVINKSSKKLLEIVNNVLDISRIQTGQIVVGKEKVSIDLIMSNLLVFFTPMAITNNIILNYSNNTDKKTTIFTDEGKLNQILTNLISNALKFTIKGRIDFGFDIKKDDIQFFVKDTGIGIDDEFKEKIFDRFMQIEHSMTKKYEGAGLGLPISRGLVQLLGGKIWYESEKDKGTTFYFTLPK